MYDYDQNNRKGTGSLVVTLLGRLVLILVFVLILLLLFPTKKSLNPLYQSLFRDNLNSMKEAAETYYTNERLPQKLEDTVKMTLREMLNKDLILPFVDKNNKECDLDNSYVEITKRSTEYELKVKLVCSEEEAFIIEHLGCTDKCANGACNTTVVAKQIEYEFKKNQTQQQLIGYSCTNGYTLDGSTCNKNVTSEKIIDATPKYESTTLTAEKVCTTIKKYECPDGWDLNKETNTCSKDATNSSIDSTTYSCPNGGTLNGTNCIQSATSSQVASGTIYSCSSGSLSGTSCYVGAVSTGYNYSTRTSTSPTTYAGETIINVYTQKACDTCTTIRYYTIRKTTSYNYCATGSISGSGCYISATPQTTYSTVYTCPSDWIKNGTACTIAAEATTISTPSYSCSEGKLDGKRCIKSATEKTNETCSCPSGYTSIDGVCTKKGEDKIVGYTCPSEYNKHNVNKCIKYITTKVSENAKAQYKDVTTTIYRWSSTPTLEGWIATGKTREV